MIKDNFEVLQRRAEKVLDQLSAFRQTKAMRRRFMLALSFFGGGLLALSLLYLFTHRTTPQPEAQMDATTNFLSITEIMSKANLAQPLPGALANHLLTDTVRIEKMLLPLSATGVSNQEEELTFPTAVQTYIGPPQSPNAVVTYRFDITPKSSDGEGVDSYLLYSPLGWSIEHISPAPLPTSNCTITTTSVITDVGGRQIAYWGIPGLAVSGDMPDLPVRSGCGPYAPDAALTFTATVRVDPAARTCPGTPSWVGIPFDPSSNPESPGKPIFEESMPGFLHGDGGGTSSNPVTDWKIPWYLGCPSPNIDHTKTLSFNQADCPTGGFTSLLADSGKVVQYCYQLLNLSDWMTMTVHSLKDDLLGTIYSEWALTVPARSGAFTVTARTLPELSAGTCITNTSTWTAVSSEGFGQVPVDNPFAPYTVTQYTSSRQAQASVCIASHFLNLPILQR